LARSTHYAVNFTPPAGVDTPVVNDLPMLCDTANLPGVVLSLDEIRHKGYGLVEKRPNSINFEDFTVSILGDAGGQVLEFVQKWLSLVTNFDGESEVSDAGIPAEMFNYPAEYWGTIELYLYDITSQIYKTYTLNKAFPVNLGAVELNWAQNDSIMRIPVTFTYRSYKMSPNGSMASSGTPINSFTDSSTRSLRSLQGLTPNANLEEYVQRFNLS
jgi:hypothetical protein